MLGDGGRDFSGFALRALLPGEIRKRDASQHRQALEAGEGQCQSADDRHDHG